MEEKSVTRAELIQALTLEIDTISKEQNRPGWTLWAILSSMAVVISMSLNELVSKQWNWGHVGLVFIAAFVIFESLSSVKSILDQSDPSQVKPMRFVQAGTFASSRLRILLRMAVYGILFFLSYIIHPSPGPVPTVALRLFAGFWIVTGTLVLVLTFLDFPVSSSPSRKGLVVVDLCVLAIASTLAWTYSRAIYDSVSTYTLSDFRLGFLSFAFSFLILLITAGEKQPLLSRLFELRRDLSFGQLDVAAAQRQAELAIAGLRTADVLQRQFEKVLAASEKYQRDLAEAHARLNLFERSSKPSENSVTVPETRLPDSLAPALADSLRVALERALKSQGEVRESLTQFQNRTRILTAVYRSCKAEVEELSTRVKGELDKADNEARSLKERFQTFAKPRK